MAVHASGVCFALVVLGALGLFAGMAAGTGPSSGFGPPTSITTEADGAWVVFAIDLNGDGHVDVISGSANDDRVAWYKNNGTGSFGPPLNITSEADGVRSVFACDLSGDGIPDVLSASEQDDKIAWYRNNGTGKFSAPITISTVANGAYSVYAQDFDGDGDLDVLSASTIDNKIAWYRNNGAGVFSSEIIISTTALGARCVFAADLDGDSIVDAISASFLDNKIAWYRNNGAGVFSAQIVVSLLATGTRTVVAADVEQDGDNDVLSAPYEINVLQLYRNNGGGSFAAAMVISSTSGGPVSIFAADLAGVGDVDVLVASWGMDTVAWYRNDGTGFTVPTTRLTVDSFADGVRSVFAADLDGDGDGDVLAAIQYTDTVCWYRNYRCGNLSVPFSSTVLPASAPGTVALVVCTPPFSTVNATYVCVDSVWLGAPCLPPPTCPFSVTVASPPLTVSCTLANNSTSSCTFGCTGALTLVGDAVRVCSFGGFWSGSDGAFCSSVSPANSTASIDASGIASNVAGSAETRDVNGILVNAGTDEFALVSLVHVSGTPPLGAFANQNVLAQYQSNGEYSLTLKLTLAGRYAFVLNLNRSPIGNGAVRTVDVLPGALDVASSTVQNAQLPAARVGEAFFVTVVPRDIYGNARPSGGPFVTAAVFRNNEGYSVSVAVRVQPDGSYELSAVPELGGTFALSITLEGIAIPGSPFLFNVDANCKPGTFSADSSAAVCTVCPPNTFAELHGARTCTPCVEFSTSPARSTAARNCSCQPGFYLPAAIRANASASTLCLACPLGGSCAGGEAAPQALPGWAVSGDTFIRCPNPSACAGGGTCTRGYSGTLCATCAPGYYKLSQNCFRCNASLTSFVIALGVVLLFIFAAALVVVNSRVEHGIFGMASFIIGINSLQIIALFGNVALPWPSLAQQIYNAVSLINLNFELSAPECSIDVSNPWLIKWILTLLLPVFLAVVFGVLYAVGAAYMLLARNTADVPPAHASWRDRLPRVTMRPRQLRSAVVRSAYHALAMLYLPIASSTLRFWQCERIDGSSTLVMSAQPSQRCFGAGFWSLVPVVIVFMLIYIVGVPLVTGLVLRWYMRQHGAVALWLQFGFLVQRYREKAYLYEIAVMLRKLGVAAAVVFRAPDVQAVMITLALFAAVSHAIACMPYQDRSHSRLDIFSMACALVVMTGGLVSSAPVRGVLVLGGLFLLFAGLVAGMLFDIFVLRRRERRAGKAFDDANAKNDIEMLTQDGNVAPQGFKRMRMSVLGSEGTRADIIHAHAAVPTPPLVSADCESVLRAPPSASLVVPTPPPVLSVPFALSGQDSLSKSHDSS